MDSLSALVMASDGGSRARVRGDRPVRRRSHRQQPRRQVRTPREPVAAHERRVGGAPADKVIGRAPPEDASPFVLHERPVHAVLVLRHAKLRGLYRSVDLAVRARGGHAVEVHRRADVLARRRQRAQPRQLGGRLLPPRQGRSPRRRGPEQHTERQHQQHHQA